jgi:hypothetical protein
MDENPHARGIVRRVLPAGVGFGRWGSGSWRMPSGYCRGHRAEPADLALAKAKEFAVGRPAGDFCHDCGRRLALASIQWSEWVVRRVEKVRFRDDRSVTRRISIDFLVREDAPVYEAPGGARYWLVPVSVMRRKTLVNYDLHDEEGRSVPLPGLRLTQHLDESVLRAVASIEGNGKVSEAAGAFIHDLIAGEFENVKDRVNSLAGKQAPAEVLRLMDNNGVFQALLHRLSFHRTLYAFIEADPRRRHRILHMSIDEPLTLQHRAPGLRDPRDATEDGRAGGVSYEMGPPVPWWNRHRFAAALGWTPTKIRFPVPAAENAASFHFEIEAPPGVDIVEASLLAGVPDEDDDGLEYAGGPSFDRIRLRLPSVGLHVAAVPNGSSSRAQVHLQVTTRGWYTIMLLSCWATFLLLGAVLLHVHTNDIKTPADVIVVLAGVAAAVATLIAQGEFPGMAGRLLALPRALAAAEAALPLIAATLFLFGGRAPTGRRQWELLGLFVIAALITFTISISWFLAHRRLRAQDVITSPWEMAPNIERSTGRPRSFWDGARNYGYTTPAVRVDSAEAWHQHFRWTKEVEAHTRALLSPARRRLLALYRASKE